MDIRVDRLDHLVLTVKDIEVTCAFYEKALAIKTITFGMNRKALQIGGQKINLHQLGKEVDPHAKSPTIGAADLCIIVSTPIEKVVQHLTAQRIFIEEGPVMRDGANGRIVSVYIYDPDGNLIEVSRYL